MPAASIDDPEKVTETDIVFPFSHTPTATATRPILPTGNGGLIRILVIPHPFPAHYWVSSEEAMRTHLPLPFLPFLPFLAFFFRAFFFGAGGGPTRPRTSTAHSARNSSMAAVHRRSSTRFTA